MDIKDTADPCLQVAWPRTEGRVVFLATSDVPENHETDSILR